MKILCNKADLVQAVNIVSKAVAVRSTISILECILISAEGNEIKMTANNTELGIETVVNGTIVEGGIIALDAKIISEIIRKLPDNEVAISTDDKFKTTIVCEKAHFEITGKSGDDFSYIPNLEKTDAIEVSQFTLKEVIRQTIFSIAPNDSNIVMTGELFEIEDNKLKVISLDGHRISIRNIELNDTYPHKKVIVPGKTLQELNKILTGEADEIVQLFITENHITFMFDQTVVVSRLIDGNYIDTSKMISSDYETKVVVNKKELFNCIDRATLLSKEGDKKPVVISVDESTMEIRMTSYIGSMNEEIEIKKEGKNIIIGFNPNFFIDVLRVIDEEEVTLYMINQKTPCVIRDDNDSYTYLILPINFSSVER
ncbi:MAG: DNA polymerase III subunit beta [Eubacterium sp.]|nr:DNA polymerase III subunit beta [Eubacterium sp.]